MTDGCRFRVHVPVDFLPGAAVTVRVLGLNGGRLAELAGSGVSPGRTAEFTWDRRTTGGERAGPGFAYVVVEGGGRRTVRTIYLAP